MFTNLLENQTLISYYQNICGMAYRAAAVAAAFN